VENYNEKILIIDNDPIVRQVLSARLSSLGYTVLVSSTGKTALGFFERESPDLVILDIALSKFDGYEMCRKIREEAKTPIIILTALGNLSNRLLGFNVGADDYILKPFSPKELEVRIRSILNRTKKGALQKKELYFLSIGGLVIDPNKKYVFKNGVKIKLTTFEFSLLDLLIKNAGESLSRKSILDNVWGYTPERQVDTRVVDVHISRLRAKIEEDSSNPDLILTSRGIGYKFQKY